MNGAKDILAQFSGGFVNLPQRFQEAFEAVEEVGGFKDVGMHFLLKFVKQSIGRI